MSIYEYVWQNAIGFIIVSFGKKKFPRWDSNSRPSDYDTDTLPLRHRGGWEVWVKLPWHTWLASLGATPSTLTRQWFLRLGPTEHPAMVIIITILSFTTFHHIYHHICLGPIEHPGNGNGDHHHIVFLPSSYLSSHWFPTFMSQHDVPIPLLFSSNLCHHITSILSAENHQHIIIIS